MAVWRPEGWDPRGSGQCVPRLGSQGCNRHGVGERFADPSVRKTIEIDLAAIVYYDTMLRELEYFILRTATDHDAKARRTV